MNSRIKKTIKAFLHYSFKPVHYVYDNLTREERALFTRQEWERLMGWLKENDVEPPVENKTKQDAFVRLGHARLGSMVHAQEEYLLELSRLLKDWADSIDGELIQRAWGQADEERYQAWEDSRGAS